MPLDPFIGEITMFAGNFAPRGWAFCNGQLLSISSNSALFSILGTTYGGDGISTFGLPDLRGRFPTNSGGNSTGPGLSPRPLGQKAGTETVALTSTQVPTPKVSSATATQASPVNGFPAVANDGESNYAPTSDSGGASGADHPNMPPYLSVNFIIALIGIFPPRN